ncbi:hypothetical protein [Streptomyces griseocarneus]|uniref:Uncharacterized protein n=1 Tax=Streptomyces griseocarneus TaxID=51201 RepID=A0ABX7RVZ7_9ACTN|nr:hypothetical protein [Streptomyces griseocarneus]QSY51419.1 hypothetical protein J3S04_11430 [Streptomyces griseocarneus]
MLILVLVLLFAAPVLACALLVKTVRVLVARRFTRRVGASAWGEGAWWWVGGAVLAYSAGVWGVLLGDAPD